MQEEKDYISELPDSIIHQILSFLPSTKEAIRTGLLSKRWKYQWTYVPVLVFYDFDFDGPYKFFSPAIIENILSLHQCFRIKEFCFFSEDYRALQLSSVICIATTRNVEDLSLGHSRSDIGPLELPSLLLNNPSLVRLDLCHYQFELNERVKWECLKILELRNCSLSYLGIEEALSGSPLLETLELTNCIWHDEIVIASKSLRKVTLSDIRSTIAEVLCPNLQEFTCMYSKLCGEVLQNISCGSPLLEYLEFHRFSMFGTKRLAISSKSVKKVILYEIIPTVIKILCPNLHELTCYECMFCDEVVQNISYTSPLLGSLKLHDCSMLSLEHLAISSKSLKRLILGYSFFYDRVQISLNEIVCPKLEELQLSGWYFLPTAIVNLPSLICATLEFWYCTSWVENILQKLKHVKELTIFHKSFEVLSSSTMRSPFLTNSLILEFNHLDDSYHGIVWALQHFTVLEKLTVILSVDNNNSIGLFETLLQCVQSYFCVNYWDSCNVDFACLVSHLRIVKIMGFSKNNGQCKLALKFIEFLWKNGRALEKVVVMSKFWDAKFKSGVYQKLLSFKRYNKHVTVELL